jgi:hypothetical protein
MNCELVVFVIFYQLCCIIKFDIFTDCILDSDRYRCIFLTKLSFSDVSEIPISFPFPELPFSILFPIKNIKAVMVLVFTDRFHSFSFLRIYIALVENKRIPAGVSLPYLVSGMQAQSAIL